MKLNSLGTFSVRHKAGDAQENCVHGRNEASENEKEDQVHQFGDASAVAAVGLEICGPHRVLPVVGKHCNESRGIALT